MNIFKKWIAFNMAVLDFQISSMTIGYRMFQGYVKKWEDKIDTSL